MFKKKDVDLDKLKYLYECTNTTINNISLELGCSDSLVEHYIKLHNLVQYDKYAFITKELLEDLYIKQELSMQTIADKLGVKKHAIQSKVELYKLPFNKYIYEYNIGENELRELLSKGYTLAKIAEIFNCSETVIRDRIKKYNIKFDRRKYKISKSELEELYVVQCKTINEIANLYKCSTATISRLLKEFDLIEQIKRNERLHIDEMALAKYIIEDRLTYKEIAIKMNLPEASIANRARKLKLHKGKNDISKATVEDLYELYVVQQLPQTEIGKIYNCSRGSVSRRLIELGIDKPKIIKYISKEELEDLYINKNISIRNIHKLTGLGERLIKKYLSEYNIVKESKYKYLTEDLLRELYVNQNLNIPEIAEKLNYPQDVIAGRIYYYYNLNNERTPENHEASITRAYENAAKKLRSKGEIEIEKLFPTDCTNVRSVLSLGLELDLYYPDKQIAIEYNGDYWHSSATSKYKLHLTKTTMCENQGIYLLNIFERFWCKDIERDKIINLLNNLLNRNCLKHASGKIKEINEKEAKEFIKVNCLAEYKKAKVYLGTYEDGTLVNLVSFSNNKIINFSTKIGYIEDYEELIQHYIENYKFNRIEVKCDRRYYDGSLFTEIGFKKVKINKAKYVYVGSGKECSKKQYEADPEAYSNYFKVLDCGEIVLECFY